MAKQKRPKAGIKRGKPEVIEDRFDGSTIVEGGEDMERIFESFGVNDEQDIADILSGSVGLDNEW